MKHKNSLSKSKRNRDWCLKSLRWRGEEEIVRRIGYAQFLAYVRRITG